MKKEYKQPSSRHLIIGHIEKSSVSQNRVKVSFSLTAVKETASDRQIEKQTDLWYIFEDRFEPYLCYDRCDAAVTTLLLAAMKYGYDSIRSEYPISSKLYYNLTYHIIPQLHVAGDGKLSRIRIEAPLTDITFRGPVVATGMSRGVDSFSTMYEYGPNFELEEYRINAFTYFQAGAHHGYDTTVGRGEESTQELYLHQMQKTREFCQKYGYPLIIVDSNVDEVLSRSSMFKEWSFDRTHTFRNLSIAMLLQKGIRRYYYSSTYTLDYFKLSLNADMAYYERWLIPHLCTGSIEFYQANQDWSRMDKVEKLSHLEECYDYLQVCLVKTGNCGSCMKCKRTLIELDSLGDDVLDRFRNSFDIEQYKREHRRIWFDAIITDKDKNTSEAHYFDEAFVCAAKNHPELLGNLIKEKKDNIRLVRIPSNGINIRALPSVKADIVLVGKMNDKFLYLGECGSWHCIQTPDRKTAYVHKNYSELQ